MIWNPKVSLSRRLCIASLCLSARSTGDASSNGRWQCKSRNNSAKAVFGRRLWRLSEGGAFQENDGHLHCVRQRNISSRENQEFLQNTRKIMDHSI
jgi:hypothetical protein